MLQEKDVMLHCLDWKSVNAEIHRYLGEGEMYLYKGNEFINDEIIISFEKGKNHLFCQEWKEIYMAYFRYKIIAIVIMDARKGRQGKVITPPPQVIKLNY